MNESDRHAELQDWRLAKKSCVTECDCFVLHQHQQQERMLVDLLYPSYRLNRPKPAHQHAHIISVWCRPWYCQWKRNTPNWDFTKVWWLWSAMWPPVIRPTDIPDPVYSGQRQIKWVVCRGHVKKNKFTFGHPLADCQSSQHCLSTCNESETSVRDIIIVT